MAPYPAGAISHPFCPRETMGIMPSPCSAPDIAMPPGSNSDIAPPSSSTSDIAPPPSWLWTLLRPLLCLRPQSALLISFRCHFSPLVHCVHCFPLLLSRQRSLIPLATQLTPWTVSLNAPPMPLVLPGELHCQASVPKTENIQTTLPISNCTKSYALHYYLTLK